MADTLYPAPSRELSDIRKRLAPDIHDAFQAFGQRCSRTALFRARQSSSSRSPSRTSRSAPIASRGHTKAALRAGASREELMEPIWVAAEMRAGGAYAHSILAIEDMERVERKTD